MRRGALHLLEVVFQPLQHAVDPAHAFAAFTADMVIHALLPLLLCLCATFGQALGMTFFAGLLQQLLQLLFINSGLCRRLLHHFGLRLGLGLGLVRDRRRKPVELGRACRDEGCSLHGLEGIARRIHRTKAPLHHGAVVNFFLRNKARIGTWRLTVRHNCPPRYCR